MIVEVRDPPFASRCLIERGEDFTFYIRLEVRYNRFRKLYHQNINAIEGESIEEYIHRFFRNLNRPETIRRFFYEAEMEDQRREGYYRAIDNSTTSY